MAKKAGRPPNPDGPSVPIRIHRDVAKMARRVADYRGEDASDLISDAARPGITRLWQKMNAEIDAEEKRNKEGRK